MAWVMLGERLTSLAASGMALTIAGLMLVRYKPGSFSRRKPDAVQTASVPITATLHERLLQSVLLLGLGHSLAYAVGNVLRGAAVRIWNEHYKVVLSEEERKSAAGALDRHELWAGAPRACALDA